MKHTVLLIDDESSYVHALAERLALRGFEPLVATDGEEGLAIAREKKPSLVILDLRMPGMDGLDVLRCLREEQPQVRVIILTGHGTTEDKDTCTELGAVAFYNKPINIKVLSQTLHDVLESA